MCFCCLALPYPCAVLGSFSCLPSPTLCLCLLAFPHSPVPLTFVPLYLPCALYALLPAVCTYPVFCTHCAHFPHGLPAHTLCTLPHTFYLPAFYFVLFSPSLLLCYYCLIAPFPYLYILTLLCTLLPALYLMDTFIVPLLLPLWVPSSLCLWLDILHYYLPHTPFCTTEPFWTTLPLFVLPNILYLWFVTPIATCTFPNPLPHLCPLPTPLWGPVYYHLVFVVLPYLPAMNFIYHLVPCYPHITLPLPYAPSPLSLFKPSHRDALTQLLPCLLIMPFSFVLYSLHCYLWFPLHTFVYIPLPVVLTCILLLIY